MKFYSHENRRRQDLLEFLNFLFIPESFEITQFPKTPWNAPIDSCSHFVSDRKVRLKFARVKSKYSNVCFEIRVIAYGTRFLLDLTARTAVNLIWCWIRRITLIVNESRTKAEKRVEFDLLDIYSEIQSFTRMFRASRLIIIIGRSYEWISNQK